MLSIGTSSLITSGKLQSDCDDLRFTNQGGQLLPHYLDSGCNTSTTKVWVQADLVPKNTTTYTLYVYYGNPSASSVSDPSTFNLYQGLVGYWNFNENTGTSTADLSINSNPAVFGSGSSAPAWTTGKYGVGTSFDGSNDYTISSLSKTGLSNVSISLWFKPSGSQSGGGILQWANNLTSTGPWILLQRTNSNTVSWYLNGNYYITHTVTDNNWYHLVLTYNGTVWNSYLNATSPSTYTGSIGTYGGSNLYFGNGYYNYFNGSIDDVRVYNRALSTAEVSQLYSSPGSITTASPANSKPQTAFSTEETGPGPIAYWKFDEGVGTTVYDSSGQNHTGVFTTAPTWIAEDQCVSGKCLNFPGTQGKKITISSFSIGTTSTISFWQKINSYSFSGTANVPFFGADWIIWFDSSGVPYYASQGSSSYVQWNSADSAPAGTWGYYSFVRSGTTVTLYLNGQSKGSKAINANPNTITTIGSKADNSYPVNGFLDDIKIYPYARTAAQIREDYNASATNIGSAPSKLKANSDGLVGYWKMDEGVGATILDNSGTGNTGVFGTGSSAPGWTNGKFGVGTSFDSNDYITVSHNTTLNPTNLTFSAWVYLSSLSNYQMIFSKFNGSTGGYDFRLNASKQPEIVLVGLSSPSLGLVTGNTAVGTTTWTHIAATYDGSRIKLFINGILDKEVATSGSLSTSTTSLLIGKRIDGYHFIGKLDEVRIYNRALSASEVSDLYNYAPGPIAHWKFDEGVGTTAYDSSSNGNNASFGTGSSTPTWTTGKTGKALNFDGNDYVTGTGIGLPNGTNPKTIEAWFKTTASLGSNIWATLFMYGTYASNQMALLGISSSTDTDCGTSNSLSASQHGDAVCGTTSVNDGRWHHGTVVINGNSYSLYIDGSLQKTGTMTTNTTGNTFYIGANSGNNFTGQIDDVRIYNYARSQSQILEDMGGQNIASSQTKLGSPILHYKFDEGRGTTTNNSGIGGTLNGTFGTGTSAPTWTTSGKFGNALSFDGSNDYVDIGTTKIDFSKLSGLSITGWVNASTGTIISKYYSMDLGNANTIFRISTNGTTISFCLTTTGGFSTCWPSSLSGSITSSTWNHFTATWDGSTMYLYTNGRLASSQSATGTLGATSSTSLYIGASRGSSGPELLLNGKVDDIKIYAYALTPDEVKQDYNRGVSAQIGQTNQTIGSTTTSLDYCIPGDTSACSPPIAEWKMDEGVGTTAYDTSGNSNNGSLVSSPTWTTGKIGKSLSFNGSSYVNVGIGTGTLNQLGNIFSVEAWIRSPTPTTRMTIFSTGYSGTGPLFGVSSGGGLEVYYPGVYVATTSTGLFSPNIWYHVVYTRSGTGSGTHKFYVNGRSVTLASDTSYNFSDTNVDKYIAYRGGVMFNGQIDQVRVYNYARTAAQVAWGYNRGGPIGWWKLDECQGSVAYDSSGIGNTGTITIGASGTQNTLGTCQVGTSDAWTNGASGKRNSSLNFDGTDDSVNIPYTTILQPPNDLTLSAWVKPKSFSTAGSVINSGYNNPYGYFFFVKSSSGLVELQLSGPGSISTSQNAVTLNDWSMITVTRSSSTCTIYINGIYDKATNCGSAAITYSAKSIMIGDEETSANSFSGQIDDVRVYNYALTAEQIRQLYSGGAVNFR